MHKPELAAIIRQNFVLVPIDVGRLDKNLDLAAQYHVPIQAGIPALVVLNSQGGLLFATEQGQFAEAQQMSYESIKDFFEKWKAKS